MLGKHIVAKRIFSYPKNVCELSDRSVQMACKKRLSLFNVIGLQPCQSPFKPLLILINQGAQAHSRALPLMSLNLERALPSVENSVLMLTDIHMLLPNQSVVRPLECKFGDILWGIFGVMIDDVYNAFRKYSYNLI